jgi:hypothetical protein
MGAGCGVAIRDSGVFLAHGAHVRRSVCTGGGRGGPDACAGSVGCLGHDSAFALRSDDDSAIGGGTTVVLGSDELDMQPPEPCPEDVVRVGGPDNVPTTQGALGDSQIDDVGNAGRSSQATHAAGLLEGERLDQAETSDGRALAIIRSSHASASACSCEVNAPRSASYSATAARPASMRRARCAALASQPE